MRLLLVIMILFATITSTFTAEAADFCQSHACAGGQVTNDVDGGDHDSSDPSKADCPECLHHCHGSFSALTTKSTNLTMQDNVEDFIVVDHFMSGKEPSSLLRPPQSI